MIKTLWFFVKIAIIAGVGVWLATRDGQVSMKLMGYDITIQSGLFFLLLFIVFTALLAIYRLVRAILSTPKVIAQYQENDRQKKAVTTLTQGLVAVAAGDAQKASALTDKVKELIPEDNPLTLLLSAQTARLKGDENNAALFFKQLSEDKAGAFLGLKGLLTQALQKKEYKLALDYARQANQVYPNQGWLLKTVYDLEIKNREWRAAEKTTVRTVKAGGMTQDQASADQVALMIMHVDYAIDQDDETTAIKQLEKAYKIDPTFVPTITRMARIYLNRNKKRKAISLVQKAFKENPHPELALLWEEMAPLTGKKNNANAKRLKWFEDLVALNPESYDGQIMAANVAMNLGYWGEAKAYLHQAEKIYPSASLYRLMAAAEQSSGNNDALIHAHIEKASEALPDKSWYCTQTGLIYQEWSAIAMPHEGFNTIVWGVPGDIKQPASDDAMQSASSLFTDAVA